ncbi:hypothetical protein HELRODRAFT_87513 [Helobdella robusta]|uniref:Short-chain dehydrogenase/reductase 3 n=1 Tax=Helobdella robusta TaxID=6412 RepID=T1G6R3_HELRO|nr:hypothetical protein HELRODRAFT_87513 [Helobdella robusta]ESN94868.1 hypothetical protein HELRODRAFT_87513 [Helobdella robusta]
MLSIIKYISCFFVILYSVVKEIFKKIVPSKPKNISGKVVLITGAGGGIGRQLALKFAAQKTKLALLDIDKATCDETASQVSALNAPCHSYVCDVSKKENVARVAQMVRRDLGEVDILVNNAGVINYKNFRNQTEEDIKRIVNVNLMAMFWTIQEFLPEMYRRNDGHIVNVSSVAGCIGIGNMEDYTATKYAVRGLSEALAHEFSHKMTNLHVSIVYPTGVDTPLVHRCIPDKDMLFMFMSPEKAAQIILDGVLTNKLHIFVPSHLWLVAALNKLVQQQIQHAAFVSI